MHNNACSCYRSREDILAFIADSVMLDREMLTQYSCLLVICHDRHNEVWLHVEASGNKTEVALPVTMNTVLDAPMDE